MFSSLNQLFPTCRGYLQEFYSNLLVSAVALFLVCVFQPFEMLGGSICRNLGYCVSIACSNIVIGFMMHQLVCLHLDDSKWRVKNELIKLLSYFFILSVVIAFLKAYINNANSLDYSGIIRFTVGGIVIGCPILYWHLSSIYKKRCARNKKVEEEFTHLLMTRCRIPDGEQVVLQSRERDETLVLLSSSVQFIRSQGGMSAALIVQDEKEVEAPYLLTISKVEEQLELPYLIRCHDSYIVNIDKIARCMSNAQGIWFLLKSSVVVPVSEEYKHKVIEKLMN